MRQLFVVFGLILSVISSSRADWLAYQHCRDQFNWGPMTVDNGNCVPGYFEGSSDRLLVSCGSGEFGVFRCTSKNCESGCSEILQAAIENGKCSNDTADGNNYKYFCSVEKPDFGRLVGQARFLSAAYFPANATGSCDSTPWRYIVRPENTCYATKYRSDFQNAVNYEDYAARVISYKNVCDWYRSEDFILLEKCLKPDNGGSATYWSFQRSPPP